MQVTGTTQVRQALLILILTRVDHSVTAVGCSFVCLLFFFFLSCDCYLWTFCGTSQKVCHASVYWSRRSACRGLHLTHLLASLLTIPTILTCGLLHTWKLLYAIDATTEKKIGLFFSFSLCKYWHSKNKIREA